MQKAIRFLILISALLTSVAYAQTIEKIVAVVDDNVVLASEMDLRLEAIMLNYQESGTPIPPLDILTEQVLESLIMERIQLDTAQRMGFVIGEQDIMASYENIAAANGLTPEQFALVLEQQGSTLNQFLRDLRDDITINELQRNAVMQRIVVTDAEIDSFLSSAEGQFWQTPDYYLGHILLELASTASPEQVIAKQSLADDIYNQLQRGEEFTKLAAIHSSGPSALQGGDIGWRKPAQFPSELAAVILRTDNGQITPPVRSAGGVHLFKVYEQRGGEARQVVQQTQAQHILIQPNQIRTEPQAYALIVELQQRIKNGESFDELAREYSDDVSNALKGGDLDWVYPGQMVQSFEDMMNITIEGEVSDPVQTEFGWHLVKVNDRKDVDVTDTVMRNQAATMIRSQRFDEELSIWMQELRSESFVQIVETD